MFLSKEQEARRISEFIGLCGDMIESYENNGCIMIDDDNYNYTKETAELFKDMNYFDVREIAKKLEYHLSLYKYNAEDGIWICKDANLKKSLDDMRSSNVIRLF